MRAVWITKHGGPEVLEVRETPDPEPGEGEVRLRAEACGLNFAELNARQGTYPDAPKPPCVVGYEAAGVVDKLGPGVTGIKEGMRAMVFSRFGAHADTVCVSADLVQEIPDAMSFEEAAAIPVNYITAYHALFIVAPLRPGLHVLLHAAAGGVGNAVLQLCKTVPDITVYGTASPSKHDALRAAGCAHPIDYRNLDYEAEVMRITEGRGVDRVLDPLGGKNWKKGYRMLKPAGHLVCYGFSTFTGNSKYDVFGALRSIVGIPLFNPISLMNQNRSVSGVHMGHMWSEVDLLQPVMAELVRLYEQGKIAPVIDSTYTFDNAAEGHQRLHDRKNIGKVVLTPS